ncbi:unnamed protein product [Amoebophrya sp. A120]|nr:unnamed protein product [Amoebophrya sp. A120]|eukprot:GSA120T00018660001.1
MASKYFQISGISAVGFDDHVGCSDTRAAGVPHGTALGSDHQSALHQGIFRVSESQLGWRSGGIVGSSGGGGSSSSRSSRAGGEEDHRDESTGGVGGDSSSAATPPTQLSAAIVLDVCDVIAAIWTGGPERQLDLYQKQPTHSSNPYMPWKRKHQNKETRLSFRGFTKESIEDLAFLLAAWCNITLRHPDMTAVVHFLSPAQQHGARQDRGVLKEGWVYKRSRFLGVWRKRWFVLCLDGTLCSFESPHNLITQSPTETWPIQEIADVYYVLPPNRCSSSGGAGRVTGQDDTIMLEVGVGPQAKNPRAHPSQREGNAVQEEVEPPLEGVLRLSPPKPKTAQLLSVPIGRQMLGATSPALRHSPQLELSPATTKTCFSPDPYAASRQKQLEAGTSQAAHRRASLPVPLERVQGNRAALSGKSEGKHAFSAEHDDVSVSKEETEDEDLRSGNLQAASATDAHSSSSSTARTASRRPWDCLQQAGRVLTFSSRTADSTTARSGTLVAAEEETKTEAGVPELVIRTRGGRCIRVTPLDDRFYDNNGIKDEEQEIGEKSTTGNDGITLQAPASSRSVAAARSSAVTEDPTARPLCDEDVQVDEGLDWVQAIRLASEQYERRRPIVPTPFQVRACSPLMVEESSAALGGAGSATTGGDENNFTTLGLFSSSIASTGAKAACLVKRGWEKATLLPGRISASFGTGGSNAPTEGTRCTGAPPDGAGPLVVPAEQQQAAGVAADEVLWNASARISTSSTPPAQPGYGRGMPLTGQEGEAGGQRPVDQHQPDNLHYNNPYSGHYQEECYYEDGAELQVEDRLIMNQGWYSNDQAQGYYNSDGNHQPQQPNYPLPNADLIHDDHEMNDPAYSRDGPRQLHHPYGTHHDPADLSQSVISTAASSRGPEHSGKYCSPLEDVSLGAGGQGAGGERSNVSSKEHPANTNIVYETRKSQWAKRRNSWDYAGGEVTATPRFQGDHTKSRPVRKSLSHRGDHY